jgi:hypothetical protein
MNVHDFPAINATLNGLSALLLGAGFVCIKRKNMPAHRACMIAAFSTSVLFLICYLTYHFLGGFTKFQDPAWFRPWYLTLLASHTILAVVIVPLILVTLSRALKARFELHKKSRAGPGPCGCMSPSPASPFTSSCIKSSPKPPPRRRGNGALANRFSPTSLGLRRFARSVIFVTKHESPSLSHATTGEGRGRSHASSPGCHCWRPAIGCGRGDQQNRAGTASGRRFSARHP